MKLSVGVLSIAMLLGSCGGGTGTGWTNTAKGGAIGGGGGAALGALIGGLIGHGKGAAIGAAIGTAVGAGTGVAIGHRMDKAKAAAQQVANAKVEEVKDQNGLAAVKVTFDSGILFNSGSSALSASAMSSLTKFATTVLNQNKDMDVAIKGYTDNQGWKNSTTEESQQKNVQLSQLRAQAVSNYLTGTCAVQTSQIKAAEGLGEASPVADNTTKAGQEQNRRVEVYLYASEAMINAANNGTLAQ